MKYIKLTNGFCESNAHKKNGCNKFGYGVTINGDYFCDINELNIHPELFDVNNLEYIEVTQEDIYQPTLEEIDGVQPSKMALHSPSNTKTIVVDGKTIVVKLPWYIRLINWFKNLFK